MRETTSESLWQFSKHASVIYHEAVALYEKLASVDLTDRTRHGRLLAEIHELSAESNVLQQMGGASTWFCRAFIERDASAAPIMGHASFHDFAAETSLWFIAALRDSDGVAAAIAGDREYVIPVDGPSSFDPDGIEEAMEDFMAQFEERPAIHAELTLEAAVAVKLFEAAGSPEDRTPDKKTDRKNNSWTRTPSAQVLKLDRLIKENPDVDRTETDIAREIAGFDETKAQTLLRNYRRWKQRVAEQN